MRSYFLPLVLLTIFIESLCAQNVELKVILTDKEGLPQNKIKNLVYDKFNYMWIGTQNGISKYNGYSFKNYSELVGKEVTALFLDTSNNLWIGTHEGLYLLDRATDKLKLISSKYIRDITQYKQRIYFITPDQLFSLSNKQEITKIDISDTLYDLRKLEFYEDFLYIGFGNNNGLKKFNLNPNGITYIKNVVNDAIIYSLEKICGNLWIGTSTGKLYVKNRNELKSISLKNKYPIQDISLVGKNFWIGTDGNGIFTLDENYVPQNHLLDLSNKTVIGSNNIHCILTTNNRDIWVGTNDSGISYFSPLQNQFSDLTQLYNSTFNKLNKTATTCFEDSNKNLFFGTNFGFAKINPVSKKSYFVDLNESISKIGGSKILSIFESKNKNIWIGTFDGGIGIFNEDLQFKKTVFPFSKGSKNQQAVNFIFQFSNEELLINSMFEGMGLFNTRNGIMKKIPIISKDTLFNYQTQTARKFQNDVYTYVFDNDIYYLDKEEEVLKSLFHPPSPVNDFYKNTDNTFWLATRGSGLFLVNEKGRILKNFRTKDGLSSNFLLRIEKDNNNSLWVSSISGLTKIDSLNNISSYDHRNGLPSREFKPFASTKLKNGNIIFGTLNGFVLIDPTKQFSDYKFPEVIISDIKFQNQSIKTLFSEKFKSTPIEELSKIEIPFKRNSFSIHFYNDDYDLPKTTKYKYRMLGLENEWINIDENTQTSYTNLNPGEYTFQIVSSNKNKKWSPMPTELRIKILSPWYWSMYTIPIYFILLVLLFYFIYRIILYKANIKKEREFSEYKLKTVKTLNENKINFFTNISHDIKTPLSLISAPLDVLLNDKNTSPENKENLNLIKKNRDRLLQLINDILDFRAMETENKLKLQVSKINMEAFLEDIYKSFNKTCLKNEIKLKINNKSVRNIYIDINKTKRILWNLISNAINYSPIGGIITIDCYISPNANPYLVFLIRDNGKGFSEEELKYAFEPYYKGTKLNHHLNSGTGLGLSIVKNLVEAHRGDIKIESNPKGGSIFTVTLPYRRRDYDEQELNRDKTFKTPELKVNDTIINKSKYNFPRVFVVEDNPELNKFLTNFLKDSYRTYSFFNGEDAFQAAKNKAPDLIISDILMPVMDGYSLCKKIKAEFSTSHIPVVLLTANNTLNQKVEGMEKGADLYLTKPFNPDFLLASINSIINNRNKLREKYQQAIIGKNVDNNLSKRDKEFIENLQGFAQDNLEKEKLSTSEVCEALNCSKSVLIRKTKGLTGLTPIAYLKAYKLNVAYKLIVNEGLNVKEVAYKVGFSDPNYFTTCFKKQFGKNPSQLNTL